MNHTRKAIWLGCVLAFAGCAETTATGGAVQPTASLTTFGPYQVQTTSNKSLASAAAEALERAQSRGDGGYGAFYIRSDGEAWGLVTGRYSEQDARRMAKIDCDTISGQSCIPYAIFVPAAEPTANAIPNKHGEVLAKAKRDTASGNYLAVANNSAGYTGFGVNYLTRSEAIDGAMRACMKQTRSALAGEEARFKTAYESAGLLNCRVFGVYR